MFQWVHGREFFRRSISEMGARTFNIYKATRPQYRDDFKYLVDALRLSKPNVTSPAVPSPKGKNLKSVPSCNVHRIIGSVAFESIAGSCILSASLRRPTLGIGTQLLRTVNRLSEYLKLPGKCCIPFS
jgi:hypothetical protein